MQNGNGNVTWVTVLPHILPTGAKDPTSDHEGGSKSFRPDQRFKVTETKQLCYFSIQSPFISTHSDTDILTSP